LEDRWPTPVRVDENWLAERFSMALTCGANYLHLRPTIAADHPLALLHIRYLADEGIRNGWNDEREREPKTWATALGALTLHRWASDLARIRPPIKRVPTRLELFSRVREGAQTAPLVSKAARALTRRFSQVEPGVKHATEYQNLISTCLPSYSENSSRSLNRSQARSLALYAVMLPSGTPLSLGEHPKPAINRHLKTGN
jgi:hypothetical protein